MASVELAGANNETICVNTGKEVFYFIKSNVSGFHPEREDCIWVQLSGSEVLLGFEDEATRDSIIESLLALF